MANILLIEPNVILARTYAQALLHVGHNVARATGAQEAVHAADTQIPDVIVLEVELAEHNGIEFLHEFRSYDEWQHIPIIINTYLNPSVLASVRQVLSRELGVKVCLYKPKTSLEKLVSVINEQIVTTT